MDDERMADPEQPGDEAEPWADEIPFRGGDDGGVGGDDAGRGGGGDGGGVGGEGGGGPSPRLRDGDGQGPSSLAGLLDRVPEGWTDMLAPAAAFLAGALFGWIVLGWWLAPVEWTDALPADLRSDARLDYVEMVAALHVRENDPELTRRRLESFQGPNGDLAAVAPIIAAISGARAEDPIAAQNAERLAADLRIVPRSAPGGVDPAAVEEAPDQTAAEDPAAVPAPSGDWRRGLAGLVIVAAGAVAALLFLGSRQAAPRSARRTKDRRAARAAGDRPGVTEGKSVAGEHRSSPTRISLGETGTLEFQAGDTPFRWTWLVHENADQVAAVVDLKERSIGAANALDLSFYEKGSAEKSEVSIVARSASDSPVLTRDLMKDRVTAPAVPGSVVTLMSSDFAIDVKIVRVAPEPSTSDVLKIHALELAITPSRRVADPETRLSFREE